MNINSKTFLVILILLHLAIALPLAFYLNVWMDEASTLYTTQNGFFYALQNAAADEKQAPLYFWLLSLWREINLSFFFARIFSIVCSLLAIKNFFDLTGYFFDKTEAGFVTAFFALHPVLIWASLEIRVYSLVILISILLLRFFYEGYLEDKTPEKFSQKNQQIFYILTAVFALYTNYYSGFILAGNFCVLLVLKRFREARKYFLQMIIAGICAVPLLWIIKQQFDANTSGFREEMSMVEGIRILWGHALTFVLPTEIFPEPEQTIVSIFRVWLARLGILWLIIFLFKNKFRVFDKTTIFFGVITGIVCGFLLLAYGWLGWEYVELRHATPLFVPLILLTASLFFKIVPQKFRFVFAAIFVLLFSYSLYHQYSPLAKRGDWIRVARFIEANEKPNQPIIVFRNFDALSLPQHYRGVNKILPDTNFFAWNNENNFSSENALKKQTEFIISQIPPDALEIWLATEEFCGVEESSPACRPLENFVEANYTTVITQDFYKERVRLLRRK